MKRLILTGLLVLGVVATSYNKGRSVVLETPKTDFEISLDNLRISLDSLNNALDGKDK